MKQVNIASKYIAVVLITLGVLANALSSSLSGLTLTDARQDTESIAGTEGNSFFSHMLTFFEEQESSEEGGEDEDNLDEEIEVEDVSVHAAALSTGSLQSSALYSKAQQMQRVLVAPKKYLLYHHLKIYC